MYYIDIMRFKDEEHFKPLGLDGVVIENKYFEFKDEAYSFCDELNKKVDKKEKWEYYLQQITHDSFFIPKKIFLEKKETYKGYNLLVFKLDKEYGEYEGYYLKLLESFSTELPDGYNVELHLDRNYTGLEKGKSKLRLTFTNIYNFFKTSKEIFENRTFGLFKISSWSNKGREVNNELFFGYKAKNKVVCHKIIIGKLADDSFHNISNKNLIQLGNDLNYEEMIKLSDKSEKIIDSNRKYYYYREVKKYFENIVFHLKFTIEFGKEKKEDTNSYESLYSFCKTKTNENIDLCNKYSLEFKKNIDDLCGENVSKYFDDYCKLLEVMS